MNSKHKHTGIVFLLRTLLCLLTLLYSTQLFAHHVLGRPSYSLNEDSNTPPSIQMESRIGDYFVTFMAFPAFPRPNEPGRVHLYASRLDNGKPYKGEVIFKVRDDSWFSKNEEVLGAQVIDDNVYRQGFLFNKEGNYLITAEFIDNEEPYVIELPLQIGTPAPVGPVGLAVGIVIFTLISINIIQRKRRYRLKTLRTSH